MLYIYVYFFLNSPTQTYTLSYYNTYSNVPRLPKSDLYFLSTLSPLSTCLIKKWARSLSQLQKSSTPHPGLVLPCLLLSANFSVISFNFPLSLYDKHFGTCPNHFAETVHAKVINDLYQTKMKFSLLVLSGLPTPLTIFPSANSHLLTSLWFSSTF